MADKIELVKGMAVSYLLAIARRTLDLHRVAICAMPGSS